MSSVIKRVFEKFSLITGERVHDENGHELPDPTPIAPPVGYNPQPTIREQMRAMIREASLEAERAGFETLEEADDFDIPDEPEEPVTDYELDADLPSIAELKKRKEEAEKPVQPSSPEPIKKAPGTADQAVPPVPDPAKPGGSPEASKGP